MFFEAMVLYRTGVGNLRPALTFDMARIRIFVTQFGVGYKITSKRNSTISRYLDSKPEASIP